MSKERIKNVTTGLNIKPTEVLRPRGKSIERVSDYEVVIPGKVCRWVIVDDPKKQNRFNDFESRKGYGTVSPAEAGREDDGTGIITKPTGDGRTYVLMATPVEEYQKGVVEKRIKTAASENEMFRDHDPSVTFSSTNTVQ